MPHRCEMSFFKWLLLLYSAFSHIRRTSEKRSSWMCRDVSRNITYRLGKCSALGKFTKFVEMWPLSQPERVVFLCSHFSTYRDKVFRKLETWKKECATWISFTSLGYRRLAVLTNINSARNSQKLKLKKKTAKIAFIQKLSEPTVYFINNKNSIE